ncbi:MAG TPA: peroxiredoxin [Polyangiaceae bacterium]|nr:peroxiredoxin [Polyangiaceae bacterium]
MKTSSAIASLFLLLPGVACATSSSTAPATTAVPSAAESAPALASAAPSGAQAQPAASASAAPGTAGAGAAAADDLVGKPAPDFTATAQDGTSVHLAALKGKRVVVYFYPKDETPGCTKEACSFRDSWQDIARTGAVLIGISADTSDSHKAFAAHYKLPFLLLSDPDGKIGGAYGVPFSGHHQRQTFVIGADGNVLSVYRKVDVTLHADQVLADLNRT